MPPPIDLVGFQSGDLRVEQLVYIDGVRKWRCVCACGNGVVLTTDRVKRNKSCGCGVVTASRQRMTVHGDGKKENEDSTHVSWRAMRERCTNPNHEHWDRYGGRGIRVHDPWNAYETFLRDMGYKPSPLHQLDRIDNNGNYEPGNVRWATRKENGRNRDSNRLLYFRGQLLPLVVWSEQLNLNADTIRTRLDRLRWTTERALSTPPGSPRFTP